MAAVRAAPAVPMGHHAFGKYTFEFSGDADGPVRVRPLEPGPYKGPTTLLLETFNPTYSHRRGYTLSRTKAAAFFQAAKEGKASSPQALAKEASIAARNKATNEAVLRLVAESGGRIEGDRAFIDTAYGRLRVHPSGPTFIATMFEDPEKAKRFLGPRSSASGKWNFHGDRAPDMFKRELGILLSMQCGDHVDCMEDEALGRACLIDQARGRAGGRTAAPATAMRFVVDSFTVQAFVDNVYAGDLSFSLYRNRPEDVEIDAIVVEPPFQRKGVGRALVLALRRQLHRRTRVRYAHADFASRASLHMMIATLGAPLLLDNGIRCVSVEEAERALPAVSRTSTTEGGKLVVEGGAGIHGAFWIGKGPRPKKSPFPCD